MRQDFQIIGEYSQSRAKRYDNEDTINMYIDVDGSSTDIRPASLCPIPGTQELFEITAAAGRTLRENGLYKFGTNAYAAFGEQIYKIDPNNTVVKISTTPLTTTTGAISWANSNTQIAIADGANLYIYGIQTNTFELIILPAGFPPNPFVVYYQDARLFVRFQNDQRVFFSAQGDFTQLDPANSESQISRPSVATGLIGTNERLFLLGDASTEVWAPPTYPGNDPIIRDNNLIYEFGCASSASVVKGIFQQKRGQPISSFVAWLATDENGRGCFVLSVGGSPIKISNQTIDRDLENFTDLSDFFGIVYRIAGSIIIEWTTHQGDKTYLFEVLTKTWSRKIRDDGSRSSLTGHTFVNNKHLVGTRFTNKIYELNASYMTDAGDAINRERVTYTFYDKNGKQITANEFIVYFETGFVDSEADPLAYLSVSYDSGTTWTTPSPTPIGRIGQYANQARWFNLGTAYSFTFRIQTFDPVRIFILGATLDWELCVT